MAKSVIFPVRRIAAKDHDRFNLSEFPNFHASGSVSGMRRLYYGAAALLVRCGRYIYNVSAAPEIYEAAR